MSKKMKEVAFDSSPHASFKYQTLFQDYLELQQETEAARSKLEAIKRKKQTLEAEVRFLRGRRKFLMKTKSSTPQQVKSHNLETTQLKKSKKDKINPKKAATLRNLPPIPNLNQKGRVYTEKKNAIPTAFVMDRNVISHDFSPSQRVPVAEFNQKESIVGGKEAIAQPRARIFDLNQISMEEEELQESFEEQIKEQHNDLKLSVCRNVGDGSTNRSGKRKISWQDPVALRV